MSQQAHNQSNTTQYELSTSFSSDESGYRSSASGHSSTLARSPPAAAHPSNPGQAAQGHAAYAQAQYGQHDVYGAGGQQHHQQQQGYPAPQQQQGYLAQQQQGFRAQQLQQYRAPQPQARAPAPGAPVTYALQGGGQLAHTAAGWLPAQHLGGGGGGYAAYQGGGFGVAVAAAPAQGAAYAGRRAKPDVPFQASSTNVGMYARGDSGSDGSDWGAHQKQLKKGDRVRCSTCGAEMDKSWMPRHVADDHGLVYRE